MADHYQSAQQKAEGLKGRVVDLIDDRDHQLGRRLINEVHVLIDEIKIKKNPRTIESRVSSVIRALRDIRNQGAQVMDFSHVDMFIKQYTDLQMNVRQFDNY